MDLFSVKKIKQTLKDQNIRLSKKLGQNFLIKKEPIKKVLEVSKISPKETVIEIGPGFGALTFEIAKRAKEVIAVEKDKRIAKALEKIKSFSNVKVLKEDILKIKIDKLNLEKYKLISNLPYYITSYCIRRFLEEKTKPESMTLIIQKEVAQRIKAEPPFMNILAISVQVYAEAEIKGIISRKSFWPEPNVDSSIIKIEPTEIYLKEIKDIGLFFKVVKAGFSHPRKQILNNFSKELDLKDKKEIKLRKEGVSSWLLKNKIDFSRRPSTLTIKEWINLSNSYPSFLKSSRV